MGTTFVIGELWSSLASLEARLRSHDYDLALGLMEASAEPPCLSFDFISERRDVLWVEELRRQADAERAGRPAMSACVKTPSRARPEQRRRKR